MRAQRATAAPLASAAHVIQPRVVASAAVSLRFAPDSATVSDSLLIRMTLLGRWLRWLYGIFVRGRRPTSPKHQQVESFFFALQRRAWSHALTLRISRITEDNETSFNTASGVLLEFENGRALVGTAWHVLDEFRNARLHGEVVALVVDNMPIATPQLVFCDHARDIGFIEVPPRGREGISAVPYRPRLQWPPPRVMEGDDLLLCGFPKLLRHYGAEILHGDLNLLLPAISSVENVIHLEANWDNLVQAGRVQIPPGIIDFGGVSGGPCFLVDAEGNPLVGLVSEAGINLPVWRIAPLNSLPVDLPTREGELL